MFSSSEDNWLAVEPNLWRAREKWGQPVKILGKKGEDRRTAEIFYMSVVKAVLLFGSETWVTEPWMEKALEGFRQRVVQKIVGIGLKGQWGGTWVYPPIGVALATLGMDDIRMYIACSQKTIAQ